MTSLMKSGRSSKFRWFSLDDAVHISTFGLCVCVCVRVFTCVDNDRVIATIYDTHTKAVHYSTTWCGALRCTDVQYSFK